MNRILTAAIGATLTLLLWGTTGRSETEAVPADALPRFQEVAPGILRGGQPKPEGFLYLKKQGVKTIVNLRKEHDERAQVEALGFHYVYLPMDARDEVPWQKIRTFLETVTDPARQPVFIHCQRGADRTGFMVGLYRIEKQGWSAEKAYAEARDIGMRWWYRGLKRQLYEFAQTIRSRPGGSGN
jgi:protein tyrosine/serine phosphatase